jgi:hypothetical protein
MFCMIGPTMSHRRRSALKILADAGQHGLTDPLFLARFTPELLGLVRDGLATAKRARKRGPNGRGCSGQDHECRTDALGENFALSR